MAGHSFNPSASAHKQVLSQVIMEETKEVQRDMKDSLKQQDFERLANIVHQEINSAEESSDGENGIELTGKPVDRLKKKTKMQLNKRVGIFSVNRIFRWFTRPRRMSM
jgi:hypothetical protein